MEEMYNVGSYQDGKTLRFQPDMQRFGQEYSGLKLVKRTLFLAAYPQYLSRLFALRRSLKDGKQEIAITNFMRLHDALVARRARYNGRRTIRTDYIDAAIDGMNKMIEDLNLLSAHLLQG
ncbi:MAG: hypothetical protein HY514_00965 [Candidatus Aenigmarchaeota archaeon]|nr:hypothetical protein [Candidatus Aenigmarchaeota archaeon]